MTRSAPTTLVQISAGAGPVEVRAFVADLAAELEAECRARGLRVTQVVTAGADHAPRSVALYLAGDARAALSDVAGTHALVARSSRRGRRARKRWFAGVSLHLAPTGPGPRGPGFDPAEVEISAARAGGPGGQNVNRRATAVRVLHRPTGISVRASDQRSQHQNRTLALDRLSALLAARAQDHQARGRESHRAAHYRFDRGDPVRTWRRLSQPGRGARLELSATRASGDQPHA
ncbi:peptide chain release factor-like protein [Haliangium sp.]|uniref:peptide chain release factor-like protein n=1 Tax=Haliangium sp. TaxID=2663208 RepID=UPI003D0A40E6